MSPMVGPALLFVYGTLMPGEPLWPALAPFALAWDEATAAGRIWDTGHGFEPAEREVLTLATLIGSIALTLILWVVGYLAMGGPR